MSTRRPPRLAAWLLGVVTPAPDRDHVLGDLEEEFGDRVETSGQLRARIWFWTEVLRSAGPLATYDSGKGGGMMTGLAQDLRGAFRIFGRAPGFTSVVILTLAIGVGGASAVYSVIRGVVLTPLAFEDSERVVMIWGQTPDYPRAPLTVGDHNVLASEVQAFEAVTPGWSNTDLLLGGARPEQVSVGWVGPRYFEVLGILPALGRTMDVGEDDGILLSHALWVRRYGEDPGVIGQVVDMGGTPMRVVGVLPSNRDANLTTFGGGQSDYDLWRLMPREWTEGDDRSIGWLRSTARLAPGVSVAAAQAEVDALMTQVNATVEDRDGGSELKVNLVPVRADLVQGVSRTLWILLGAVGGVLLIAASNVAHLMLGRGDQRTGEIAVRSALGGSAPRLLRQLIVESGVLAAAGGLAGLGVAWLALKGLLRLAPASIPRLELVELDSGVVLFALGATGLAAVVFALIPAFRTVRTDLARSLGERTTTELRHRQGLSRGLVVVQVALSLALVSSTTLLLRSLDGLSGVDLGFEADGVITFALEASEWGESPEAAAARMVDYQTRMAAIPGVQAVGFTNRIPLAGGLFTGNVRSDEMVAADEAALEASYRYITPGYLGAMGARILAGRAFHAEDGMESILVDELTAEQLWPGEDPIGRQIAFEAVGEEGTAQVIGVVGAMKHSGVADDAERTVYAPMLARALGLNFRYGVARVTGDPLAHLGSLEASVSAVDANAVLARVRTMRDFVDEDVAGTRFATALLSAFGVLALVLATVGLHGVMAVSMRRRTREIGIRMALGGQAKEILRKAVVSGATLVVLGIGLGVLLSMGAGQVLGSLLYGVEPGDAPSLVTSAAVILSVGTLGAYLPARLVLAVDPARTLREE